MQRLLKDAQAITGVKYNIDNLADVYTAIGVIQEKLGIAGTTAKEAEATISGSAAMMKAAWQNTLVAIAGGGDIDKAINNLVYSIQTYFKNIVPVVERSLQGIGEVVEKIAPLLVQTVAKSLIKAIPSLVNAVYQMIVGLAKGIYQGIMALFKGEATQQIQKQTEAISESVGQQEALTEAVEETEEAQKGALAGFDELNNIKIDTEEVETPTVDVPISAADTAVEMEEIGKQAESTANGMSKSFEKVIAVAKKIWDSTPVKAYRELIEMDINALGSVFKNLGELGKSIWKDMREAYDIHIGPLSKKTEKLFTSIFEDALKPIRKLSNQVMVDIAKNLKEAWDRNGAQVLNSIGNTIDAVLNILNNLWNNILAPVIVPALQALSDAWNQYLEPLIQKVADLYAKVVEYFEAYYVNVVDPLVKFLSETLKPLFDVVGQYVYDFAMSIFQQISGVFSGIIDFFEGILDILIGLFTGDFSKVKSAAKSAFNGLKDAILSILKGTINMFISMINGLIGGINLALGAINKIPGVEIPKMSKIPRLAQGTVVPPNKEFMAVLGDNTKEHEIVSPISTMKQAFLEALTAANINTQDNRPIVLQIDGKEIARAVRNANGSMGTQTVFGGFANAY